MHNEKYLKTKIACYNWKFNINFCKIEISKGSYKFVCLSVILIHSAFRTGKNYYPQVFVEECKCVIKEKKMREYITDDI